MRQKSAVLMLLLLLIFSITCDSPNEQAKKGYTAKEAEQLASTRALDIWENPVLVSMETPEAGGGINREGRLAKGENGIWRFGYFTPGIAEGLAIEVIATKTYNSLVPLDNLGSLQEILPNYIDSSDALAAAEKNGGKDLTDVKVILCTLLGEPIWPLSNPTKVAWQITYKLKSGQNVIFYIEAYSGAYLGRG